MDEGSMVSAFGKAPNWHHSGIMGVDGSLGVVYYCAEAVIFALDASDLSYLAAWTAHAKRASCLAVTSAAMGPSVATGGSDRWVRLWAPKLRSQGLSNSEKPLFEHAHHKAGVSAIRWANGGQTVISADTSGKVIVWSPRTGEYRIEGLFHTPVTCMDTVDDGAQLLLAIGQPRGRAAIGHQTPPAHFRLQAGLPELATPVTSRRASANEVGPALSATSVDGMIRVWTHFTVAPHLWCGVDPKVKAPTNRWVSSAWVHYEGEYAILYGSPSGKLNVRIPFSKKPIRALAAHTRPVFALVPFTGPSGSRVVTTSMDRTIMLWDWDSLGLLHSINTLGGPARCLDFALWQPTLAGVGVSDKLIRLWRHQEGAAYYKKPLWRTEQSTVCKLAFHPTEGGVLAFANSDGLVGVFNEIFLDSKAARKETIYKCPHRNLGPADMLQWVPISWVTADAASDSVSALVSFSMMGPVVCNFYPKLPTEPCLSPLFTKHPGLKQLQFAVTHRRVAAGFSDGEVKVFAMPAFTPIYASTYGVLALSLAWSLDDRTLAAGHDDGTISLHHASRFSAEGTAIAPYPQPTGRLLGHTAKVLTLSWSPHAQAQLASGDATGSAYVWDLPSTTPVAAFEVGLGATLCVRWCPFDPSLVFACAEGGLVWKWHLASNPFVGFPSGVPIEPEAEPPSKRPRVQQEAWSPIVSIPRATPTELMELDPQTPPPLQAQPASYHLKLWQGQILESLDEINSLREPQDDLTKWLLHLALSPLAGKEAYSRMLLQTALAHRSKGATLTWPPRYSPRLATSPTPSAVSPPMASICKRALPKRHPHLIHLYLGYGKHLLKSKLHEDACRWFLLGDDVTSAINAVASPATRESLKLALELSLKHQHETYPLRPRPHQPPPSLPVVASLLFTLTDGWYACPSDGSVENEDVIDIGSDSITTLRRYDPRELYDLWRKFGVSLAGGVVTYLNKDAPVETFALKEILAYLSAHVGDRSDDKAKKVYGFLSDLAT
ncbi:Gem-associated protein 5 [Massospora cicadina]|nr:Gem-associated protein 5 [Massospora cicadina]